MDTPDIASKSFLNFMLMVGLALLIINALFDAVNVATGKNFKGFYNKPISSFHPGKANTGSSSAASTSSGS